MFLINWSEDHICSKLSFRGFSEKNIRLVRLDSYPTNDEKNIEKHIRLIRLNKNPLTQGENRRWWDKSLVD